MTTTPSLEETLRDLRESFDQSFAIAPVVEGDGLEDILAVRIAGDPYGLRMREIRGLVATRRVVPVPSRRPELLGVAGHRGAVVTVYSLAALLGYPVDVAPTPWLALVGESEPLGFGFAAFDGFFRARGSDLRAAEEHGRATLHVRSVVVMGNQLRRVVDVPSVLRTLEARGEDVGSRKET